MESLKLKFAAISIIFTACIAFSGGICSLIVNLIFLQERTDYVVILLALCFILCIVASVAMYISMSSIIKKVQQLENIELFEKEQK